MDSVRHLILTVTKDDMDVTGLGRVKITFFCSLCGFLTVPILVSARLHQSGLVSFTKLKSYMLLLNLLRLLKSMLVLKVAIVTIC